MNMMFESQIYCKYTVIEKIDRQSTEDSWKVKNSFKVSQKWW